MKKIKLAVVGCGAIGSEIIKFIHTRLRTKVSLFAIYDKNRELALKIKKSLRGNFLISEPGDFLRKIDMIIEAASVEAAEELIHQALKYKKDILLLSVGALLKIKNIFTLAARRGINIYIPSGAICGLDGIGALSKGKIKKISLITTKPLKGFGKIKIPGKKIILSKINSPKIVFQGKAEEAVKYFPRNINVAATIFLATGISPQVTIIADPKVKYNSHHIKLCSSEANIDIKIENIPSKTNPRTSQLAILSTQQLLFKLFSSVKIGT